MISATLGYLIQSSIKLFFDRNIQQIKTKANLEIEKYKSEIQLESEKGKIQYSLLQEKRALIIEKFYVLLEIFNKSVVDLMAPLQFIGVLSYKEKENIAIESQNKFMDYYRQHKIYLSKDTCKLIDSLNEKFNIAWRDFQFKDKIVKEKIEDDLSIKSWKTITEEIPLIREKIEDDFRNILGIK